LLDEEQFLWQVKLSASFKALICDDVLYESGTDQTYEPVVGVNDRER
jgi:hypothetical protein